MAGDYLELADCLFILVLKQYCAAVDDGNVAPEEKPEADEEKEIADLEDLENYDFTQDQMEDDDDVDNRYGYATREKINSFLKSGKNMLRFNPVPDDVEISRESLQKNCTWTSVVETRCQVLNNLPARNLTFKQLLDTVMESSDVNYDVIGNEIKMSITFIDRNRKKDVILSRMEVCLGSIIMFDSEKIAENTINGRGRVTEMYVTSRTTNSVEVVITITGVHIHKGNMDKTLGNLGIISEGKPVSLLVKNDNIIMNPALLVMAEDLGLTSNVKKDFIDLLTTSDESILLTNEQGMDKICLYLGMRHFKLTTPDFQHEMYEFLRICYKIEEQFITNGTGMAIVKDHCYKAIVKSATEISGVWAAFEEFCTAIYTNVSYLVENRGRAPKSGFTNLWIQQIETRQLESVVRITGTKRSVPDHDHEKTTGDMKRLRIVEDLEEEN